MNILSLAAYAFEHKDQIQAAAADFAKAGAALLAGVSLACSIVAPWLPAAQAGTAYAKVRELINLAGHNYRNAKNAN